MNFGFQEHFGFQECFAFLVASNLDGTRTMKTEIIRDVLSQLPNTSKEKTVMVGDHLDDIVGARNNGIDSIAVAYGYGTAEELQRANPTYLVHSVEELNRILAISSE